MILLLFCNMTIHAQRNVFVAGGIDPLVLLDKDRVGGGNVLYIIQLGIQNYNPEGLGYKFGFVYEDFDEIHYTAKGFQGGIVLPAPTVPFFQDLTIGNYWYLQAEVNLINRKGLPNSQIYNSDEHTSWVLGLNAGIVIEKPFGLPFNAEFVGNAKDRLDTRVHYGTLDKFNSINDITFSGYIIINIPLEGLLKD